MDLSVALSSFTRAFNLADLLYRVTNFVTALEFLTIERNQHTEISYKLRVRSTFMLKDADLSEFIKKMYSLRSHISHRGDIPVKQLQKFYNGEISKLFDDVYKLEDICRKVLKYYLKRFIEDDKLSVENIIQEIDRATFVQLEHAESGDKNV